MIGDLAVVCQVVSHLVFHLRTQRNRVLKFALIFAEELPLFLSIHKMLMSHHIPIFAGSMTLHIELVPGLKVSCHFPGAHGELGNWTYLLTDADLPPGLLWMALTVPVIIEDIEWLWLTRGVLLFVPLHAFSKK